MLALSKGDISWSPMRPVIREDTALLAPRDVVVVIFMYSHTTIMKGFVRLWCAACVPGPDMTINAARNYYSTQIGSKPCSLLSLIWWQLRSMWKRKNQRKKIANKRRCCYVHYRKRYIMRYLCAKMSVAAMWGIINILTSSIKVIRRVTWVQYRLPILMDL